MQGGVPLVDSWCSISLDSAAAVADAVVDFHDCTAIGNIFAIKYKLTFSIMKMVNIFG